MKNLLLLMLLVLNVAIASAQSDVLGVVVDAQTGQPLAGAALTIAHTTQGTIADANGQFRLSALTLPTDIVVSYIGYQEQTVHISSAEPLRIALATAELYSDDDNSDFTFTESQLDDDSDVSQTVTSVLSGNNDPYASKVGYLFSAMRFRVRAYENQYSQTYINGLLFNDIERGNFNYALIGGMNDATRNQESVSHHEYNHFGLNNIGGASNINTRASQFATGNKLTVSVCNRNYKARAMYTYATGLLANGWAFAGSVGYRWANEGVIEGTFYNSLSYFLSAEKHINDKHSISLATFGAPTERAQQAASTEEAYWLANSHYYNPNWGYQNGEKRNARIVNDYEPTTIITWDWDATTDSRLTVSGGFKYALYSTTALGWAGDAYDPRPDYYKNLPSSVFDVYDETKNNGEYLAQNPYFIDQYNTLLNHWTSDKANRQIDWDRMYYVNSVSEANGGEALYYQERRHNNQAAGLLSATWKHNVNQHHKYTAGIFGNATRGMHYKTMADLLGASKYTDLDKYSVNDYGAKSNEAQNDMRHPNRQIGVDDKFGYNYNIDVLKARAWGQYQFAYGPLTANAQLGVEATSIERNGKMQNGRAPHNSYGKSGKAQFVGSEVGASVTYHPGANHYISVGGGYAAIAPQARNSFVSASIQNNFVNNLELEKILSGEASYQFRIANLFGKVSGYYTQFADQVEQTAFYNDQQSTFTYLTMSNIEKEHYGIEVALNYQILSSLSVHAIGTVADAKYTNNPLAQISYEGMDYNEVQKLNSYTTPSGEAEQLRVVAENMRVSGTPLTALNFGINYNINGWFFEANINYYDRIYIAFSPYRRLTSTYKTNGRVYTPSSVDNLGRLAYEVTKADIKENGGLLYDNSGQFVKSYAAHQERFSGDYMIDLSVGKNIRLRRKSLSINLSVNNLTNNTNMRTGGYEQNRDDYYYSESNGIYTKGEGKAYRFSRNSKYYYANSLNAFLNIGFKF